MKPWSQLNAAEKAGLFAAAFALPDAHYLTIGHVFDFAQRDCVSIHFTCHGRDQNGGWNGGWNCILTANDGRSFYARSTMPEDAIAQALLKSKNLPDDLWK